MRRVNTYIPLAAIFIVSGAIYASADGKTLLAAFINWTVAVAFVWAGLYFHQKGMDE